MTRTINGRTLMEHERHRWSYMTRAQMSTRLDKITTLDKLDCFILVARERGDTHLERCAISKRRRLDPNTATPRQTPSIFGRINFEF